MVFRRTIGALPSEADGRHGKVKFRLWLKKYLRPERAHIIAVGDASKIRGAWRSSVRWRRVDPVLDRPLQSC
jgi:hypothetical protein